MVLGGELVESFFKSFVFIPLMKLIEFQQYLKEQHINLAFFVHPDPTLIYFTQMKPSYAMLFITPQKATFFLTKLDHHPHVKGITVKTLQKGWEKQFSTKKAIRVGINKECLPIASKERIKKIFPQAKFVDVTKQLSQLRSLKTPAEVEKIARACAIVTKAFNDLIQELPRRTLKTELDIAFFLEKRMREQGAEVAFPTIVANGKNAAIPHHLTSTQKLKRGFVVLDFGAQYQQYCADMTRVLFLGKPTEKEKEFYQLLLDAQLAALAEVQLGKKFGDLDKIARKKLGKYSSYFIHSLGHGVGIEVHEQPSFLQEGKIQSQQVFTIEPGIYFPGKFGLRIEDTLLFDGNIKILTKATKELVQIPW
ncbi:MAG: Xaa-Pro aminopeptidase [archaeon GW2011_AR9]|nr:MAG: Xaa-Pro aminopeptidase [archaeon GW2011_AR9]